MPDTNYYSFVSFLRKGIANSVPDIEDMSKSNTLSGIKARAVINVGVKVTFDGNTEAIDFDPTTIPSDLKKIELYGPGDVIGIDKKAVIRTDPQHCTTNFEPNYLATIEFYEEDFPWRFTPLKANPPKLTPWLALVVLEESELNAAHEKQQSPSTAPLQSFKLSSNPVVSRDNIFVSPGQLWAWAHVHVNEDVVKTIGSGDAIKNLRGVLDDDGDYCYSRIICPRRLSANKSYWAFLIPTFEAGRLAGLGRYDECDVSF